MTRAEMVLAVPSKGRLGEETLRAFADAGLVVERPGGARAYVGTIAGRHGLSVRFLPAAEIARELLAGTIDAGVTGADLIHEATAAADAAVIFAKRLGFGAADVVVAVPLGWIDVTTMADLADAAADFRHRHGRWLRVATKYVELTRRFFATHDLGAYRIIASAGATEAAPAAGAADLIVDITTSGETLKANGLRVLDDGLILKTEANLIVAKSAVWGQEKLAELAALLNALGVAPEALR